MAEVEVPILWPPDVKSWLTGKDSDAGKDWRQEESGIIENEMFGWYHRLSGHRFEQTPGDSEGQGSLVCCSPWGRKSWTWLNSSHLYLTTRKTIALTIRTFVSKVISLLFNMLSRFVWASLVAQLVKNPPAMQKASVPFLVQEDPLEAGMATPYSILAWRIPMDRGAWWATVHGVAKSQTQLSNKALYVTALGMSKSSF